jgi:ribonuclease BN (tRNA processing enzyme)
MTTFLLNDRTALDAGALTPSLSLSEQEKVRRVIVTHAHFDHVATLPFFFENVYGRTDQIDILAPADVLTPLRKHLFNDALWPDFSRIPSRQHASLKFRPLREGRPYCADGLTIMPIAVSHIVPTYGYRISVPGASILFSGDTGPTRRLWRVADETADLKAIFLEVSFGNDLAPVARASKHLTPSMLPREIGKTRRKVPVYLYHMKPPSLSAIEREVAALGIDRLEILEEGQTLEF